MAAHPLDPVLDTVFPLIYGACFLGLLWQAFRVMGRGFRAIPRPGDAGTASAPGRTSEPVDRTGRLTIHPELLDADGQLTREDLLTVRFGQGVDGATDGETPRPPDE